MKSIQPRVFIYFFECQSSLSDEAEGGGIDAVGCFCDIDAFRQGLDVDVGTAVGIHAEPYHARGIVDFDGHFLVGRDMEHACGRQRNQIVGRADRAYTGLGGCP